MTTVARATCHHGNLRQTPIAARVELARVGGRDAVVLREATHQVGVSLNAAYRHFADRDALLADVCDSAQASIARAIEKEFAGIPQGAPTQTAKAQLRAVGTAYVRFALEELGCFARRFRCLSTWRAIRCPRAPDRAA